MDIQGRIIKITPTQTVGQNGFQRRDVIIMTEEQYPQYIPFDFVQEKCALLDNFQEGQIVRISFNIRGREWVNPQGETKYIVNLQGWRIENAEMAQKCLLSTHLKLLNNHSNLLHNKLLALLQHKVLQLLNPKTIYHSKNDILNKQ